MAFVSTDPLIPSMEFLVVKEEPLVPHFRPAEDLLNMDLRFVVFLPSGPEMAIPPPTLSSSADFKIHRLLINLINEDINQLLQQRDNKRACGDSENVNHLHNKYRKRIKSIHQASGHSVCVAVGIFTSQGPKKGEKIAFHSSPTVTCKQILGERKSVVYKIESESR